MMARVASERERIEEEDGWWSRSCVGSESGRGRDRRGRESALASAQQSQASSPSSRAGQTHLLDLLPRRTPRLDRSPPTRATIHSHVSTIAPHYVHTRHGIPGITEAQDDRVGRGDEGGQQRLGFGSSALRNVSSVSGLQAARKGETEAQVNAPRSTPSALPRSTHATRPQ